MPAQTFDGSRYALALRGGTGISSAYVQQMIKGLVPNAEYLFRYTANIGNIYEDNVFVQIGPLESSPQTVDVSASGMIEFALPFVPGSETVNLTISYAAGTVTVDNFSLKRLAD